MADICCPKKRRPRRRRCSRPRRRRRSCSRPRRRRRSCSRPRRRTRSRSCSRPRRRSCSRPRRRRRSKCKKPVCCMRPGRKTNNGYLNFLREFRKRCCGLSPQQTIIEGAKKWNCMTRCQKQKYIRMARRRR